MFDEAAVDTATTALRTSGLPGFGIIYLQPDPDLWESFRASLLLSISELVPVVMVHPVGARAGLARRGVTGHLASSPEIVEVRRLLPGGRFQAIGALNRRLVAAEVRSVVRRLGWSRGALWFAHPSWAAVSEALSDYLLSVYDCLDLYAAFPNSSAAERARVGRAERRLLQRPGVAFALSPPLLDHLRGYATARSIELLPPVAAPAAPVTATADSPRWQPPVIGVAARFNRRYNYALLRAVARAYPRATMVLAGLVEMGDEEQAHSGFAALASEPNVVVTGQMPRSELLSVISHFDVGLVPYNDSPANAHAGPVKLFDYLAARVPAVATSVADFSVAVGLVRTAADDDQFVDQVAAALESPPTAAAFDSWIDANSGPSRARAALDVIARELARA